MVVAKARGIAGAVIDGAYRDIGQLRSIQFPMFLKGVAPATGPKRGPGEINVPVCCGGVIVYPGDIVVGDEEGVVVVPRRHADRILGTVKPIKVKSRAEDWDWDTIVERDEVRDRYFDEVLKVRGCEWVIGSTSE